VNVEAVVRDLAQLDLEEIVVQRRVTRDVA
jgi:hypothetical protein